MASLTTVRDSVVAFNGSIALDEIVTLKQALEEKVRAKAGSELCIDLSGLVTVSSVALSLLLCGLRVADKVSCQLSYANMPQKLFDIMRVGGLESLIPRRDLALD